MTNMTYQFEFVTGCPGSMWSSITSMIRSNLHEYYDTSDLAAYRCYRIPDEFFRKCTDLDPLTLLEKQKNTHYGSYFGPFNEYGNNFDCISKNYSVSSFTQECLLPFSNDLRPIKQIKSHWFAYNLDWLWENFKGHHLLLIWKDPKISYEYWHSLGGLEINYPSYKWYRMRAGSLHVRRENIMKQIQLETDLLLDFVQRKQLSLVDCDENWFDQCYKEFSINNKNVGTRDGVKLVRSVIM